LSHADLPRLLDLYAHYIDAAQMPPLSHADVEAIWHRIDGNPAIHYLLAERDRDLLASLVLTVTPAFIRGGSAFATIEHVVTHRDHRRRGIARALVAHAMQLAWDEGCTEVMLLTGARNHAAHGLYRSLGFDGDRKAGFIAFRKRAGETGAENLRPGTTPPTA
jgi:GNAT superfamily N-acetyltransferase